jgi:hypothetical protein
MALYQDWRTAIYWSGLEELLNDRNRKKKERTSLL